jgi:hypothetical protein
MEVVTYANKSSGLFEELVHNEFDVPVKVLGWGTKWNGFLDKYKGMVTYLREKEDTDIVVFLDGFDTKINKDPKDIVAMFEACDCKMLVSKDPEPMGGYISHKVFDACVGDSIANSGLYMGYAKYLLQVLEDALQMTCEDDQRNLNALCGKYDFIKVDEDKKIFENIAPLTTRRTSDAVFVSYPASLSMQRVVRSLREYSQFFKWQFIISMLLLLAVLPNNYKWIPLYLAVSSMLLYTLKADKSCV